MKQHGKHRGKGKGKGGKSFVNVFFSYIPCFHIHAVVVDVDVLLIGHGNNGGLGDNLRAREGQRGESITSLLFVLGSSHVGLDEIIFLLFLFHSVSHFLALAIRIISSKLDASGNHHQNFP